MLVAVSRKDFQMVRSLVAAAVEVAECQREMRQELGSQLYL